MSELPSESKTPISSSSRKSVFLRQWWLIKVGSKLGVGGFRERETLGSLGMQLLGSASNGKRYNLDALQNGVQVFNSPAISKRLNDNTLEAVDGTIITITGWINRSRSLSYGFSHKVCDHFLFGFPCTWEDYYSCKSSFEKCGNSTQTSLPTSFDDIPVTRVRDMLMSATESEADGLMSVIFRDIQKQCCEESCNQSEPSIKFDEVSRNSTETEADHNIRDDGVPLLNPTQNRIEESHEIDSFPVDLHEKDLENYKETKDEYKQEDKMTMSAKKRAQTTPQKRYPLRSTRTKKNT